MTTACFDGCLEDTYFGDGKYTKNPELVSLEAALGPYYEVVEHYGYDAGYGEHGYETIYRCYDGRLIVAECGGCSCGGSGSWRFVESLEEAQKGVSEYRREDRRKDEEGWITVETSAAA